MPTNNELYFGYTDISYLPSLKFLGDFVDSSIVLVATASVVAADNELSVDFAVSTGTVLAAATNIRLNIFV